MQRNNPLKLIHVAGYGCGSAWSLMKAQQQVADSRHRMQDQIRIEEGDGWKVKIPRAKQAVFSSLAELLPRRYEYFRNPDYDRLQGNADDHSMAEKPA
ncbi:hypothetical protein [Erythrobacter sp. MTPC3]|uniref:hypothetical protein n=1 Tax=Erythrobacter sp. MTPC3 TaxID=3056564 RepID=UPI0036F2B745